MRAFQSQLLFFPGFCRGESAFSENGHFKNVQNAFLKNKPKKFEFLET